MQSTRSRVLALETRANHTTIRMIWLDTGETEEQGLQLAGIALDDTQRVIFLSWVDTLL